MKTTVSLISNINMKAQVSVNIAVGKTELSFHSLYKNDIAKSLL